MRPTNKEPPGAQRLPQQTTKPAQRFGTPDASLKNNLSGQRVGRSVAPAVYKPQSKPNVVQQKNAGPVTMKTNPVGPPVYRPQPLPRVLQTKSARHETTGTPARAELKAPVAPAVYRPEAKQVAVQAKMTGPLRVETHPVGPSVYRPQSVPRVVQTKNIASQPPGQKQQGQNPLVPPTRRSVAKKLDKPKDSSNRLTPSANKLENPVRAAQPQPQKYRTQSKPHPHVLQLALAAVKPVQPTTKVTLYIAGEAFSGGASGQYGHAEMEALRKFLIRYESSYEAWEVMQSEDRSVSCTRIPVCGSCSTVLETLGFEVHELDTEFSEEKSGGVSWGGNLKVEQFMRDLGYEEEYQAAKAAGRK